ncbi:MAG TPA: phasin family protein [Geminicoccaceae bacterium]|nr:phasin family protein [Geminicoccaceae bacterium]
MADPKQSFDFEDLSKRLGELKFPEIDWDELMAAQQKNWEALGQANKAWLEGAQNVMRREVEILQAALAEATAASKELMKEGDARVAAEKRLERAKSSFEKSINDLRELSEAASQANRQALEVIQQRALESFDELKMVFKTKR